MSKRSSDHASAVGLTSARFDRPSSGAAACAAAADAQRREGTRARLARSTTTGSAVRRPRVRAAKARRLARLNEDCADGQIRTPNANAYAERFVRSIKAECLDRIIPFGERHFRRAVAEYVTHYHHERNHQGLGNVLIDDTSPRQSAGRIRRRPRLGGLLNYYERAA